MNAVEFGSRLVRKAQAIRSGWASQYFVTLGKADPDLIFVAGTGRSGTTWLAELLVRSTHRRLVFEPFRNDRVPLWERAAARQYLRPQDTDSEFLEPARQILRPDFRNDWADHYNERLVTRGRIVKDIRANLMLRWLYEQLGPFPIIFLIRHPGAVATSWLREGWCLDPVATFLDQEDLVADYLSALEAGLSTAEDSLDQLLYIWSIETIVPLCQFNPGEMLVVFYEDLLIKPIEEFARISAYIGDKFSPMKQRSVERPSSTTTPGVSYGSQHERLLSWREELTCGQLARVESTTALFGLDQLFGDDGLPTLSGDDILGRAQANGPPLLLRQVPDGSGSPR